MRRTSTQKLRKLHLIICEDTKSSQYYLKGLKEKFGINIKIEKSEGTDISNIIRTADFKSKRTGLNKNLLQTYCLFDKDNMQEDIFQKKLNESLAKGYINAYSVPCYEYWLLLHLMRTDRCFHTSQECCAEFIKAYNQKFNTSFTIADLKKKKDIFEELSPYLEDALKNADSLDFKTITNPYTNMHQVVRILLKHKTKN